MFPRVVREPARVPRRLQQALQGLLGGRLPWPAYVFGPAGVGKTCAALLVHDTVPEAFWADAELLAEHAYEQASWPWRFASRANLVIVDEVGCRSRSSEREYLGVKRMADQCHRLGVPVLWVSNLTPEQLRQHFDDRVFSRLCCGTVIPVEGEDQRFSGFPIKSQVPPPEPSR